MALTDVVIRNLKPGNKSIRHFDGGLYLEISPPGWQVLEAEISFRRQGKTPILGCLSTVEIFQLTNGKTSGTLKSTSPDCEQDDPQIGAFRLRSE